MKYLKNVSLKLYSTMRLGGTAQYVCEVKSAEEVIEAETWAESRGLPLIMIGSGSNIVWRDEGFKGLLVINKIRGFKVLEENDNFAVIKIGAGMVWDDAVAKTVKLNLSGLEYLSLIPGYSGATPVQNVGAYGQEMSNILISLDAYDRFEKEFIYLTNKQCAFGYRTSRFKTTDKGRFLITSITVRLTKKLPEPPFYSSLQAYFDEHKITKFTPSVVRQAVIAIRSSKLPNVKKIANNGSFFANPIINKLHFKAIKKAYPNVVSWDMGNKYKLSAGWLVEQAGFKDKRDVNTGMGIWPGQALVVVNYKARSTANLLDFRQKIITAVQTKFGITLEQEPELLP